MKQANRKNHENSQVIEFPESTELTHSEQAIEKRLQDLSAFVADITESGFGLLLLEQPATEEIFEELRVKEVALHWILRVAKYSTGQVRQKLWSDIEYAVTGLEKTADVLLHSKLAWFHPAPSIHQRGFRRSPAIINRANANVIPLS